ncbi:silent information regulator family protein [Pelomyxa schiedti]|nr:silent information regulator family protein [Pelomyxa schiedti]
MAFLSQINGFDKAKLKETDTVVRHFYAICADDPVPKTGATSSSATVAHDESAASSSDSNPLPPVSDQQRQQNLDVNNQQPPRSSAAPASGSESVAEVVVPRAKPLVATSPPSHSSNLAKTLKRISLEPGTERMLYGLRSHEVVLVENCVKSKILLRMNQRLSMIVFLNCVNCTIKLLDSAVLTSRTCRIINCTDCEFAFEDIDARKVECFGTQGCRFVYIGDTVLLESEVAIFREGCRRNTIATGEITSLEAIDIVYKTETVEEIPEGEGQVWLSTIDTARNIQFHNLIDAGVFNKRSLSILQKLSPFISPALPGDEAFNVISASITTSQILSALDTLSNVPQHTPEEILQAYDSERCEYYEPEESLRKKAAEVGELLRSSKHTVVYTGAGISTSTGIGDFRGPQGLWTCQDKGVAMVGKEITYKEVHPTFAHYAITELAKNRLVQFLLTTNVDGLHARSDFPRHILVELHGSCYKEVCRNCKKVFIRDFDIWNDTNALYRQHETGRLCDFCHAPLQDTGVAFGETYRDPLDSVKASWHARKSTLGIILGTSMNVQSAASYPEKALRNGGKLVLVNLQATPYDYLMSQPGNIRVWARIDEFLKMVLDYLGISPTWAPQSGADGGVCATPTAGAPDSKS